MKKSFIFFFSIIVISFLIFLAVKERFNINKIVDNIENSTNLIISLKNKAKWEFYPIISYQNNISILDQNNNLIIENSSINIYRDYWPTSPFNISFQSPSILYKGLDFRDAKINSEYNKNIIVLKKFTAKIIEGNIDVSGLSYLDESKKISVNGSYKNIFLNRVLQQLNIANWDRINIKLSSSNFNLTTMNNSTAQVIANLNGEMNIQGSVFFISTEEERFGAALLSLLADKMSNMLSVSKSINYLLNTFSDIPSKLSGKLIFNNGVVSTDKLFLQNTKGKAKISATLDMKTNTINGKINFYENDKIFLKTELKGNLQNPEILVGGEVFANEGDSKTKNIKKIFEDGLQSLVDSLLNSND